MQQETGLVFDIQGYSVHDGPGCRTLVFLSGCPLRCRWCANPEGLEPRKRLMFLNARCKQVANGCMQCVKRCPYGALAPTGDKENQLAIDRSQCDTCTTFDCVSGCLWGALGVAGKEMTVAELYRIIDRDRQYWGDSGGVTFTGGEPLLQRKFIVAILKRCQEGFVHTAVETSAHVDTEHFLNALRYVNFAFIDVKHMDPEKHRAGTGVSNDLTLRNIRFLAASNWPGRLVLRVPVIAGFNDDMENMAAVADFMQDVGLHEINLLPFHRMGDSKYSQLGLEYDYKNVDSMPLDHLKPMQQMFMQRGIACYIGSHTPF